MVTQAKERRATRPPSLRHPPGCAGDAIAATRQWRQGPVLVTGDWRRKRQHGVKKDGDGWTLRYEPEAPTATGSVFTDGKL
jgi:hypothetical protein